MTRTLDELFGLWYTGPAGHATSAAPGPRRPSVMVDRARATSAAAV
ncbi:MAG: hypothetical protein ACIAS6_06820 [Phycisphaerales bacterium JB060]